VVSGLLILILLTSAWVGATQYLKATYQAEEMEGNETDLALMEFFHCRDIAVSFSIKFL
jgi:hypothetical protein